MHVVENVSRLIVLQPVAARAARDQRLKTSSRHLTDAAAPAFALRFVLACLSLLLLVLGWLFDRLRGVSGGSLEEGDSDEVQHAGLSV